MIIDLEEIATVAIQEYIDLHMSDMFLHILEGWIFDREGLDFDEMIRLAIKNKIDRKFKTLEINQMIVDAIKNSVESELKGNLDSFLRHLTIDEVVQEIATKLISNSKEVKNND